MPRIWHLLSSPFVIFPRHISSSRDRPFTYLRLSRKSLVKNWIYKLFDKIILLEAIMSEEKKQLTYAAAGVDIDAGNKAVELMKDSVRAT